jgi:uroporphyrinogen-III synthase
MSERRYNILSTTSLPFERLGEIPGSIKVSVVPFIKIIPRPSVELLPTIAEFGSGKHNVVFTSTHAVKFVSECLKFKPAWKIYCIRNETRIAVENFFGHESIVKYAESASSLAQYLIEDGIKDVLFFCGDQRLNVLPDSLKKRGIRLTELIVYTTRLTPVQLNEQPDAILFFSPTAVRSFFSMNNLAPETRVFAMGKTTASALSDFTSNSIFISPETDKAFVFNMAVEYAASHPST